MTMPRFILHIGLPKTATTALQRRFFEEFDGQSWRFIGVRQPRERAQDDVYKLFMTAINACESDFKLARTIATNQLTKDENNLPWLLSEEMLCVDSKINWQQKIQRAANILQPFSSTVLVTIRDPIDGLESLWAELYDSTSKKWGSIDNFVNESNQARVYLFDQLFGTLKKCFPNANLKVVPFELLEQERFAASISEAISGEDKYFKLPVVNAKKRNRHGNSLSRGKRVNSLATTLVMRRLTPDSMLYKFCRSIYRMIQFRKWNFKVPFSSVEIPAPSINPENPLIVDSRRYLRDNFDIEYPWISVDQVKN